MHDGLEGPVHVRDVCVGEVVVVDFPYSRARPRAALIYQAGVTYKCIIVRRESVNVLFQAAQGVECVRVSVRVVGIRCTGHIARTCTPQIIICVRYCVVRPWTIHTIKRPGSIGRTRMG